MPDIYATITEADPVVVEWLGVALETRAAEPAQRAMREAYLAEVPFPRDARVLDIGCGTGAVSRDLAMRADVADVIGADLTPILLERARRLSEGIDGLTFVEADARALPFPERTFDVVVMHTLLCHVPEPESVLAEAARVLRPGGWLAVFDGDYATASVALNDHDPLQCCVEKIVANLVHDPWIVRRLTTLGERAGFEIVSFRGHGYAQTREATYLLTLVDRGADSLAASGIGAPLADALKAEARRRVAASQFYGQIAYASLIARSPG